MSAQTDHTRTHQGVRLLQQRPQRGRQWLARRAHGPVEACGARPALPAYPSARHGPHVLVRAGRSGGADTGPLGWSERHGAADAAWQATRAPGPHHTPTHAAGKPPSAPVLLCVLPYHQGAQGPSYGLGPAGLRAKAPRAASGARLLTDGASAAYKGPPAALVRPSRRSLTRAHAPV
jgi:hypothetical protein